MTHIIVELNDGSVDPLEFLSDPAKTAAQVLIACAGRFQKGEGTLSPKDEPNFVLMGEDKVAGGVTYIYIPIASMQGVNQGVPSKVLDVHILVKSHEDLNMKTEYSVLAGVIRFQDFEEALGVKVLEYALSLSDAAPGTGDYYLAVGTTAPPSNTNTTSLWLKVTREDATTYCT